VIPGPIAYPLSSAPSLGSANFLPSNPSSSHSLLSSGSKPPLALPSMSAISRQTAAGAAGGAPEKGSLSPRAKIKLAHRKPRIKRIQPDMPPAALIATLSPRGGGMANELTSGADAEPEGLMAEDESPVLEPMDSSTNLLGKKKKSTKTKNAARLKSLDADDPAPAIPREVRDLQKMTKSLSRGALTSMLPSESAFGSPLVLPSLLGLSKPPDNAQELSVGDSSSPAPAKREPNLERFKGVLKRRPPLQKPRPVAAVAPGLPPEAQRPAIPSVPPHVVSLVPNVSGAVAVSVAQDDLPEESAELHEVRVGNLAEASAETEQLED